VQVGTGMRSRPASPDPGASREWSRMAMAASGGERRPATYPWERDPGSDAARGGIQRRDDRRDRDFDGREKAATECLPTCDAAR